MKKLTCVLCAVLLTLSLTACTTTSENEANSSDKISSNVNSDSKNDASSETKSEANTESKEESKAPEKPKMTSSELESEISKQDVRITSTRYIVQDEDYKTLYPDLLQATFINNSDLDLRDVSVAFVAWDKNGLPVKIKGQIDFSDGSYVQKCKYSDVNLIPGTKGGEGGGLALDGDIDNIDKFKAIVVSYESFDGDTWENPLFDTWIELYSGKRYS